MMFVSQRKHMLHSTHNLNFMANIWWCYFKTHKPLFLVILGKSRSGGGGGDVKFVHACVCVCVCVCKIQKGNCLVVCHPMQPLMSRLLVCQNLLVRERDKKNSKGVHQGLNKSTTKVWKVKQALYKDSKPQKMESLVTVQSEGEFAVAYCWAGEANLWSAVFEIGVSAVSIRRQQNEANCT